MPAKRAPVSYLQQLTKTLLSLVYERLTEFARVFPSMLPSRPHKLSRSASGYVLIVVTCFIPIVLLGIKYAERLFEFKDDVIRRTSVNQKKCAREAALAVARNWNPGLTLAQQKDAVYKVADAVYNAHPTYHGSTLGSAVPGVIERDSGGNVIDLSSNSKTVLYKDATKHMYIWDTAKWTPRKWNVPHSMWLGIDKATDPSKRISAFDEVDRSSFSLVHQDIFTDPHPLVNIAMDQDLSYNEYIMYYTPTVDDESTENYLLSKFFTSGGYTSTINQDRRVTADYSGTQHDLADSPYTSRLTPSGTDYVDVSVVDDKIKVRTDKQTAYAEPARCDVDIVLAVPVNGAACNVNNRDMASDTPDDCYVSTSTTDDGYVWRIPEPSEVSGDKQSPKSTPIYQMGQALKAFVKEHFYHTRGVNMSLIPYSGKLSISPDRATAWTVAFPQFNSASTNTQLMIGACLYGTSGEAGANLTQDYKTASQISGDKLWVTDTPYYWGDVITGCPIMFRAGVETIDAKYGANRYFSGKMLDKSDPSGGNSYKYFRMNLNPCYVGYANMLSMRCERQCTHFLPNPYYMIEPTADLVKIYEMCNALYPIYDTHNISNFIFAALEWAQNFLEPGATEDTTWTRDTKCDAVDGSGSSGDTRATLSRPSKTASGRKKAIILLVNKPDWFEPGEMTYLGFNNDFSEVPTVLSDKIDFSIDYSDTSKKFLDGTAYDGTIQGTNKILKFSGSVAMNNYSGYYECNGSEQSCSLTFSHPGLIKIVVEPSDKTISWTSATTDLKDRDSGYFSVGRVGVGPVDGLSERLLMVYQNGELATSTNGINWQIVEGGHLCDFINEHNQWNIGAVHGNGVWCTISQKTDYCVTTSINGVSWKSHTSNTDLSHGTVLAFGEGLFMTTDVGTKSVYTSKDGENWEKVFAGNGLDRCVGYGNGMWLHVNDAGTFKSTDHGKSWTNVGSALNAVFNNSSTSTLKHEWYGCVFKDGYFYAVNAINKFVVRTKDGTAWEQVAVLPASSNIWQRNITYYNGKFYVFDDTYKGNKVYIGTPCESTFQFSNINANTQVSDTNKYTLTRHREFYVEPGQIKTFSGGKYSVSFKLKNVRLISAEITNRSYTKVAPICSCGGSAGNYYIKTNAKVRLQASCKTSFKYGCIEFYKNNGVEDNVGKYVIKNTKDFVFRGGEAPSGRLYFNGSSDDGVSSTRGPNFGHNLYVNKVAYYTGGCSITNAKLENQYLRDYVGQYGRRYRTYKQLILNNGVLADNRADSLYPYRALPTVADGAYIASNGADFNNLVSELTKFRDSCISVSNILKLKQHLAAGTEYQNGAGNYLHYVVKGLSGQNTMYFCAGTSTVYYRDNVNYNVNDSYWFSVYDAVNEFDVTASEYLLQLYIKNGTTKTLQLTDVGSSSNSYADDLKNNKGIYLRTGSDGNKYICFQGDGKLTVTVAPTTRIQTETFTIDPERYNYEQQSDGSYKIYLYGIKESVTLSCSVIDTDYVFKFSKPTVPSRSSVVDYSQNVNGKPKYNSSLIIYTNKLDFSGGMKTEAYHDGYWHECGNNDWLDMKIYSKNDFYLMLETSTKQNHYLHYGDGTVGSFKEQYGAAIPGLHCIFMRGNEYYPAFGISIGTDHTDHRLIYSGCTQPINTVLYSYGIGTGSVNTDNYVDPQKDFNRMVMKKLTSKACEKLKSQYGSDVRVYVVKYRKQANWGALTRVDKITYNRAATAHSYAEIDACATSTGGKVYDAADETALKTKLDAIAAEIKDWAGYEEAKNVE